MASTHSTASTVPAGDVCPLDCYDNGACISCVDLCKPCKSFYNCWEKCDELLRSKSRVTAAMPSTTTSFFMTTNPTTEDLHCGEYGISGWIATVVVMALMILLLVACVLYGNRKMFTRKNFRKYRLKFDKLLSRFPRLYQPVNGHKIEAFKVKKVKIEERRGVFGVARLPGRIFIVQRESPVIKVFRDTAPFNRLNDIEVPVETMNPSDILAMESGNLYIADGIFQAANPRVLCVKADDPSEVTVIDLPEGSTNPRSLAHTPNGNILVTTSSALFLYAPTPTGADLIKKLTLPQDVTKAEHSIQLELNTYAVCQNEQDNNQVVRLRETDDGSLVRDGQKFLNHECKQPTNLVQLPGGVLLIADWLNDRVLVIDPQFNRPYDLLNRPSDWIDRPSRLCYFRRDDDSHCLVAGLHREFSIYNMESIADATNIGDPVV